MTQEEIEGAIRTHTDQIGRLMDQVQKKGFMPYFRCGHSQLLLPGDYIKEWGRKYGIGLGPQPVSEVLDTDYETAPPEITPSIRSIEQIMHPVGPSFAQVDLVLELPELADPLLAVLEQEDPYMERRARIVYQKQLANPRGRVNTMRAAWAQKGR